MKVLHIVRRYGPVGGMERYVWEASRALCDLGHEVEVVCETCTERPNGVVVHELGAVMPRPRWLALLRFGMRVRRWLDQHPRPGWVIHSHERLGCHDVTTFHGPPFATIFEKPWWRWISLRVVMQLFLEVRELAVARQVFPVSGQVAQQLLHFYPWVRSRLMPAVAPAVSAAPVIAHPSRRGKRHVVGFVGREWRRKGLIEAISAFHALRTRRPDVEFLVIGADAGELKPWLALLGQGVRVLPWMDRVPYEDMDVLLHPARAEPYGMVIAEAMAAGVPVVVSDVCGAACDVTPMRGEVLSLRAGVDVWVDALVRQLDRTGPVPVYRRAWSDVASEMVVAYAEPYPETGRASGVAASAAGRASAAARTAAHHAA